MLGVYLRGWAIISPINFSTVSISILISAVSGLWRLQTDNGRGVRGVFGRWRTKSGSIDMWRHTVLMASRNSRVPRQASFSHEGVEVLDSHAAQRHSPCRVEITMENTAGSRMAMLAG
ncbi:hypothetical protein NC77_14665 [Janthinobacterium lividum]|nr:hypothetical protein NC77_14665 [Janthinobacterium lividum]